MAADADRAPVSDALRSELIFLPEDGSLTRFDDGFVLSTPSNPGYWWGNCLHFDHPPGPGDFGRWTALFASRLRAAQPDSTHMTFGWEGDRSGAVEPFTAAGFEHFTTLALAVDRGEPVVAPHAGSDAIVAFDDADWSSLLRMMVDMRLEAQAEAAYAAFAARRIDGWRALQREGRGRWLAVRDRGGIVAALGVFVERRPGPDGRRIGRFQHVVTHPSARRRGLAGRLVESGARYAFDRLAADTLLIYADEHGAARRVYEACGFRARSRHHGLERPG